MKKKKMTMELSLNDQMSKDLLTVSNSIADLTKEMKKTSEETVKSTEKMKSSFRKFGSAALKTTLSVGASLGKLGLQQGFSEIFNMEKYKLKLNDVVKDTKKAGVLMSNAVKLANNTQFETGDIVDATANMEKYGLSSERWLKDVADMAGSTNKSIGDATAAMTDVAIGEFGKLEEFGINKDEVLAASNKKYGENVVFNAAGEVVNQAKLMDVVQEMMQKKYKNGSDKLANTTEGMWSKITSLTKSSLAKILGMQDDGTVKTGSVLEKVQGAMNSLGKKLQEMQNDGTIDKIAEIATKACSGIFEAISKTFNFLSENKATIEAVASAFVGFYIGFNAAKLLSGAIKVLGFVIGALNVIMGMSPLELMILGIMALVAGFVLLYNNSETFRKALSDLWGGLQAIGSYIGDTFVGLIDLFGPAIEGIMVSISSIFEAFKEKFNEFILILKGIIAFIVDVFTVDWQKVWENIAGIFGDIGDGIKEIFNGVITFISEKIEALTSGIKKVLKALGFAQDDVGELEAEESNKSAKEKFKLGGTILDQYALGGIVTKPSICGEAGAEIVIPLKSTTRSKSLLAQANSIIGGGEGKTTVISDSSNSQKFEVHIHGNVYGEDDLINKVGTAIVGRVKSKMPVVV